MNNVVEFTHRTSYDALPPAVIDQAKRCLLDLTGVAAAGSTTALSAIVRDHAARYFGSDGRRAAMLFDGRRVSVIGAALAGAMTIDAIDAHDGHRLAKGHAGCGILPAALALADGYDLDDGGELISLLVVGYELGTRLGVGLHRTTADYHTSGAWIAVACAALAARVLSLDEGRTRHALGIAEYHGPRSQMMRAIDHPTMVKDGSGWGAMAGISAAHLASDGFTGGPALTVESDDVTDLWADLGSTWMILDQYFKPYPICRWGQPAVAAVLALVADHGVASGQVARIEISTFHEACRLSTAHPTTTEEAQYSLPWPVAAAVVRGTVGVDEIGGPTLTDPEIRRLAAAVELVESEPCNREFPARRLAAVTLVLHDGSVLSSDPTEAPGDPERPMTDEDLSAKYLGLATPAIGVERAAAVVEIIDEMTAGTPLYPYLAAVTGPGDQPSVTS